MLEAQGRPDGIFSLRLEIPNVNPVLFVFLPQSPHVIADVPLMRADLTLHSRLVNSGEIGRALVLFLNKLICLR